MSLRNIRPSTNAPNLSTSESTSSDPKKGQAESSSSSSKRRRVPESVTRNACVNCKKARAKCDGRKPCARCAGRVETSPCVYEVHVKHAKEELVKQIKELETKESVAHQILQALSTERQVDEIVKRLRNGEAYDSIVEWLSPPDGIEVLSTAGSSSSAFESLNHEMEGTSSTVRWTVVTSDSDILDHLFQLYFAWVHPVHTLFSEGHFVNSFKRDSRATYCSPVLVNAICAMACHLHSSPDGDEIARLGKSFSDAVRSDIDPEDKSLTTVQAFAILFLVDCARGRGLRAASYLKVACTLMSDVGVLEEPGFAEVMKNTSRGIRSLNIEWAQITFQVPSSQRHNTFDNLEENDEELDQAQWYFYRFVDDACPAWSGLLATTNNEKAKLTDIINDVTTMFYSHSGPPIQACQILQQYARYTSWRERLPSSIGEIESNASQALPHVLSLLILYSNSVVQLLRPLLNVTGLNTAGIDEIVWRHAQTGLFLLDQHYRTQYTCRYQPVFQMFNVLHLCDVIVRLFPGKVDGFTKSGTETMDLGIEVLMQSCAGFPVAGILQDLLRRTAIECNVNVESDQVDTAAPPRITKSKYIIDDIIDACTRLSYLQPTEDIDFRLEPRFAAEWDAQSVSQGFKENKDCTRSLRRTAVEERAAQHLMQISKLLND